MQLRYTFQSVDSDSVRSPTFTALNIEDTFTSEPKLKLPSRFWQYLTPAEIISILWLFGTLPLCFVHITLTWFPLLIRLFGIPIFLFLRPLWIMWSRPSNGKWLPLIHDLSTLVVIFLPAGMYPLGYMDVGMLIESIWSLGPHNECERDQEIMRIEEEWFGSQLAVTIHESVGTSVGGLLFSEYLQFCYFGLFISFFVVHIGLYWSFRGRDYNGRYAFGPRAKSGGFVGYGSLGTDSVDEHSGSDIEDRNESQKYHGSYDPEYEYALMSLLICSYSCWVVYLCYPVAGPLWCLPPKPKPVDYGYVFSYINLWLQDTGASHGTATPSSHCIATVGLWIVCILYHKPLAIACIFVIPGLLFATVYCHYHYAVDSVIGIGWGFFTPVLAIYGSRCIRQKLKLKSFIVQKKHDWRASITE